MIIQIRIEKHIYSYLQEIYNTVTLLNNQDLRKKQITTDMKVLTEEVHKVAQNKKIEIDTLKIKEEYRREFIGNVAHELKTPLFTTQGFLETIIDNDITDPKLVKKYLERATNGVERLIKIVSDLDMITKLESTELKIEKETFDIVDLVKEIFQMLEQKAEKNDITLMLDKEHYRKINVFADKEKIYQVLVNLISNSIKYGRERGITEVSIEELTDKKYIVRITDNGMGIEKKHLNRIFERFYRIDDHRSRKIGGSGLGLSIVKHIIEAHDNHIYVDSELNVGSEFSFTIDKAIENTIL
ncbi:sensor histidine kinase [Capnocytophaga sp. ARDL2]|uniref:sensor histidine kinase n=1 Tax=Capnocytophaga sp. ARDL2 TaxID=3238809 RepID=UPI003555D4D5